MADEQAAPEQPATTPVITFEFVGTNEQICALIAALATASQDFGEIVKDKEVEVEPRKRADGTQPKKYTFMYAPLENSIAATRPHLAKQGIFITQPPSSDEVRTIVAHKGGGMMISVMFIPKWGDVKELGGLITYLRRYAYNAVCGIAADDDSQEVNGREPGDNKTAAPADNKAGEQGQRPTPAQTRTPAATGPARTATAAGAAARSTQQDAPRTSSAPAAATDRELNNTEKREIMRLVRDIHGEGVGDTQEAKDASFNEHVTSELAFYMKATGKPEGYKLNLTDYVPFRKVLEAKAVRAHQDRTAE